MSLRGVAILLLILIALIAIGERVSAATPAQAVTLQQAQDTGWVPTWLTPTDKVWVVEKKEGTIYYIYVCMEDSTLFSQHVLRFKRANWRNIGEGRSPFDFNTPKVPLSAAQKANCFTAPPPPLCPYNPLILASDPLCVEPVPVCTVPQPADDLQTVTCTAPLVGSWVQTRTYSSAPYPTCWVPNAWGPTTPPAGACVTPTTYAQISWVLPTKDTNGNNLPATGQAALKQSIIAHGPCANGTTIDGTPQITNVPVPTANALILNRPLGRYCAQLRAENNAGQFSDWTPMANTVLGIKPPLGAGTIDNSLYIPQALAVIPTP